MIQFWRVSGYRQASAPPTLRIADVITGSINKPVAYVDIKVGEVKDNTNKEGSKPKAQFP